MRVKLLLPVAAIACIAFSAADVFPQTCRVACGVTAGGRRTYMEVYEYDYVTVKPEFPGGSTGLLRFVNNTRQYPAEAYKKGVQGRVTCSFVVNTDGSVSHIQILKGVEASLNAEALRIFSKMPAWSPGFIGSHAVPVRVIYPVVFRK